MDQITGIIQKEISNRRVFFVFPSGVAAGLWARKAGEFAGVRSIAVNRFMAWDRFKETAIRAEAPGRQPASSVIRKLFAEQLVKKNAAAPFLLSLIPGEYAREGARFAPSLAALLPSLGYWERRVREAESYTADAEDRDFAAIKTAYTAFLEENRLFEPSWQDFTLRDEHNKYYIFFPEAMEDYGEYGELLENNTAFEIIRRRRNREPLTLYRYPSVRAEIRDTALEIRRLHETENLPYEDMAVNVPRLDDLAPYLEREFALYGIPCRLGAGKPLSAYGAGRLFTLIQDCVTNDFSFAAVKSLLLNIHLPWARPDRNRELIEFGVRHNCVSSFREKGRLADIWREAFKLAPREELLRQYYEGLKKELAALAAAKSFLDIRRGYFAFRNASLDMSLCTEESNAVLARCIEELSGLIRLEEEYPHLTPGSPFAFFISLLGETPYVPVQGPGGVNIFPYRVAAAAPYRCHFVLNASQDAASVVYRPLDFLRQDKRRRMGLDDADVSGDFFYLYRPPMPEGAPGYCRVSASVEALSGWTIPHSFFTGPGEGEDRGLIQDALPQGGDPFYLEKSWWAAGGGAGKNAGDAEFPPRLFPVQREGFQHWRSLLRGGSHKGFSLLAQKFPSGWPFLPVLQEEMQKTLWSPAPGTAGKDDAPQYLRVSATSLNRFFFCPAAWFFERILTIEDYSLEAELMDDMALGNLYHEILKNLFQEIHDRDGRFLPEHLGEYRTWAEKLTGEAAEKFRAFQGPLSVPLLSAQSRAIAARIARLLETEADYFPRYAVAGLERRFTVIRQVNAVPVLLVGTLDRISVSEDQEPVIIDYKTNYTPSKTGSAVGADGNLTDCQMAMYVALYEENSGAAVGGAYFMSVKQNDLTAVIGKPKRKRGFSREEYQPTLDALEAGIRGFAESVERGEFFPRPLNRETCGGCGYKKICRTTYTLNSEPVQNEGAGEEAAGGG
ncbi:MAG: PD-(D/E)XK nuclease family protein [Treponema sp.]|jgi:RecB family exonuclease|nr:PD-(D/E)XK nuclease family protein [Treponema sp.]